MAHMHAASKHGATGGDDPCNGGMVLQSSTNMHFHGLNVPPVCHQDDVINTIIQSGDPSFQYSIQIPANEPPGLYWYHPHPHGNTSVQVGGGASGAIIVEGTNPLTAGLTERVLIARQQFKPAGTSQDPDAGAQLTLNFQPAVYPEGGPAPIINVQAGKAGILALPELHDHRFPYPADLVRRRSPGVRSARNRWRSARDTDL